MLERAGLHPVYRRHSGGVDHETARSFLAKP